jgi:hypothetical protein
MFDKRVLRRIFWPKRNEVTGERRELHTEEINDLYCSPNIFSGDLILKNEMGGACSTMGENRGVYRFLVGKPEGKRSIERPKLR